MTNFKFIKPLKGLSKWTILTFIILFLNACKVKETEVSPVNEDNAPANKFSAEVASAWAVLQLNYPSKERISEYFGFRAIVILTLQRHFVNS